DGPQVETDPVPEVRAAYGRRFHSKPLPTMLMNTSSRVGSDFCNEWTFLPWDVIVLKISATGPSSSRMKVRCVRFFEISSVWEKFFTPSMEERSEEHTSELQSRFDLVCRLLLEKKKYINSLSINLIPVL